MQVVLNLFFQDIFGPHQSWYKDESISNQPNLFPVEIHLFFFDVIAL